MEELRFRDVVAGDISAIKEMINEAWDWGSMVEDPAVLDAILGLYFNQVLYGASFGKAALVKDEIVGVIFGHAQGDEPHFRMLLEEGTQLAMNLLNASPAELKGVQLVINGMNDTYQELLRKKGGTYDGTLDFFVVSEKARGLGVGKKLWLELAAYFREKGTKSIYVYTDTDCNFGFYEYQGFEFAGDQDLSIDFGVGVWNVKILMYEMTFQTVEKQQKMKITNYTRRGFKWIEPM